MTEVCPVDYCLQEHHFQTVVVYVSMKLIQRLPLFSERQSNLEMLSDIWQLIPV
jgi:hypothetical protein